MMNAETDTEIIDAASLMERVGASHEGADDGPWTMSRQVRREHLVGSEGSVRTRIAYAADRVVPYCPGCGTVLSKPEVAPGDTETEDWPDLWTSRNATERPRRFVERRGAIFDGR